MHSCTSVFCPDPDGTGQLGSRASSSDGTPVDVPTRVKLEVEGTSDKDCLPDQESGLGPASSEGLACEGAERVCARVIQWVSNRQPYPTYRSPLGTRWKC